MTGAAPDHRALAEDYLSYAMQSSEGSPEAQVYALAAVVNELFAIHDLLAALVDGGFPQ